MRLVAARFTHVPPRILVFIATTPRSGGSLLCESVSQTGLLGHPTEFFHREVMIRQAGLAAASYADCCVLACRHGATSNGIVSSKIVWHQFDGLTRTVNINRLFPRRTWVFLRRRDRIGQAVSLAIAAQTQRWNSKAAAKDDATYSRSIIEEKLAWLDAANNSWVQFFFANGIEPLTLWYEDIEADMHSAIANIARFVGGADLEHQVRRSPPFAAGAFDHGLQKQRGKLNDEWRNRFGGES